LIKDLRLGIDVSPVKFSKWYIVGGDKESHTSAVGTE